jgi:hypothetical protein
MELIYRLTRDDHMRCCALAQERIFPPGPLGLGWRDAARLLPLAGLAVVLLALAALSRGVLDERTAAVASLGYLAALASVRLWGRFWQRQYWARWLPDGSRALSELHLTMDGDGVVCSDADGTTRYAWRAFCDVSERAGFILLWFDRGGECIVVPGRVLASDDARRDFVAFVRERIAQAAAPACTESVAHCADVPP